MNNKKLILFVLIMATCLSQFATDIYIPSIMLIANYMKSSISDIQLSIPIYLFGVAITQLIYGPLSEGIGRKITLIGGLMIMVIGNIVCITANSPNTLIIGRLIQGCGGGAAVCLWRSIFRDMFTGKDLSIYGGYLSIFITFIVPAAPLLGSFLTHYFKWQSTFIFMLGYSCITIICVSLWLKETNTTYHVEKLKPSFISSKFGEVIKNKTFLGITLITFLIYGTILAWLTAGPVLLIKYAHTSPSAFGWFNFIGCGLAYGIAGRINAKLVHKYGINGVMKLGLVIVAISGITLLISQILFGITFWGIAIPIIILYFGSSLVWPNTFSIAFSPFGHIVGYASAVYSFVQICGGAIIGSMVSTLPSNTSIPLAIIMILTSSVALAIQKMIRIKLIK